MNIKPTKNQTKVAALCAVAFLFFSAGLVMAYDSAIVSHCEKIARSTVRRHNALRLDREECATYGIAL